MEPVSSLNVLLPLGVPLLFFFFGVIIGERAGLYRPITPLVIYITSIPTGVLIVGLLAGSASTVTNEGFIKYVYFEQSHKLMTFCGAMMFYGIAAPELFVAILNRIRNNVPKFPTPPR